jgi:hypothetical protein
VKKKRKPCHATSSGRAKVTRTYRCCTFSVHGSAAGASNGHATEKELAMLKTILATAGVALAAISVPAFAHNDHRAARYYYPPARPVVVVPRHYYYAPPPRIIYAPPVVYRAVPVYPRSVAPAFSIRFDFPL